MPRLPRLRDVTALRSLLLAAALVAPISVVPTASPAGDAPSTPVSTASLTVPAPAKPLEGILGPILKDQVFRVSTVGLQVVNVRTGEEVFSQHPDRDLLPASTMKVLTAATALETLGPAYRFTTDVYTDGEVDANGVLVGNLYVQGHGDPQLTYEQLWRLIYDLKNDGITKVQGSVIFDEGFFEAAYRIPGWDKREDLEKGPAYFASLSALSVAHNVTGLVVAPGAEAGTPAKAFLEMPGDYVEIDSTSLTTGALGSRRWFDIEREVTADKKLKLTLSGSIPLDQDTDRYYRSVPDPTAHFMALWKHLSAQVGIAVTGKYVRGEVPARAERIRQIRSEPLTAILMEMNKHSNNFIAEQVLRTIGAETQGLPGTTEKGITAVGEYLSTLGISPDEYRLVNGSGLSRDTHLKASHLTAVLVDMAQDEKVGNEFLATLAIGGLDGTLWARFREEPGRVRGKTGTIDGVHCLAGYVEGSDHEEYAFAFLVNDVRGGSAPVKRVHDRFLRQFFSLDGAVAAQPIEDTSTDDPE